MIPKVAHVIWLGSDPSTKVRGRVAKFRELNPEWGVLVWTKPPPILGDHQEVYEQSDTYSGRSNVLRFVLLHRYGGLYFDTDIVWQKPVSEEMFSDPDTLNASNERPRMFNTSVMASPTECPLVQKCLDTMLERVAEYGSPNPSTKVTGVDLINAVPGVAALKGISTMYPDPDAAAIHLRDNSWKLVRGKVNGSST